MKWPYAPLLSPLCVGTDMRDAQDAPTNILRYPPRLTVVQHTHSLRESVVNRVLLARRQLITTGHDHHVRAASDTVLRPLAP